MYLYDGKSQIQWPNGTLTREEMDGNPYYPQSNQPCVLYGEPNGITYDWRYLFVLCNQYNVEFISGLEDYQPTLDLIIEEMNKPKPTINSVNEKANIAKSTADSVQTQIDALTSAFEISEVSDGNTE